MPVSHHRKGHCSFCDMRYTALSVFLLLLSLYICKCIYYNALGLLSHTIDAASREALNAQPPILVEQRWRKEEGKAEHDRDLRRITLSKPENETKREARGQVYSLYGDAIRKRDGEDNIAQDPEDLRKFERRGPTRVKFSGLNHEQKLARLGLDAFMDHEGETIRKAYAAYQYNRKAFDKIALETERINRQQPISYYGREYHRRLDRPLAKYADNERDRGKEWKKAQNEYQLAYDRLGLPTKDAVEQIKNAYRSLLILKSTSPILRPYAQKLLDSKEVKRAAKGMSYVSDATHALKLVIKHCKSMINKINRNDECWAKDNRNYAQGIAYAKLRVDSTGAKSRARREAKNKWRALRAERDESQRLYERKHNELVVPWNRQKIRQGWNRIFFEPMMAKLGTINRQLLATQRQNWDQDQLRVADRVRKKMQREIRRKERKQRAAGAKYERIVKGKKGRVAGNKEHIQHE